MRNETVVVPTDDNRTVALTHTFETADEYTLAVGNESLGSVTVDPDEIRHVTNSYSRRRDIEHQYKTLKSLLSETSSKDDRVRLCSFTFAALLYDLWRLAGFLVKTGPNREKRSPPVVTAKAFVGAVGRFLREVD